MNSPPDQSMTDMVQTIRKIAVSQQQLAHKAKQQYSFEVEYILRDNAVNHSASNACLTVCSIFVSMMGCFVYIIFSVVITLNLTPWQPLRVSMHIVKCGMKKKILRMGGEV